MFYFSKDTIRYISIPCTDNLTFLYVSDEVASREAKLIELLATYITQHNIIPENMSLIQGKVKQHIDGSMQNDTAVFSSITEIGHPCMKPPIFVIWMNYVMIIFYQVLVGPSGPWITIYIYIYIYIFVFYYKSWNFIKRNCNDETFAVNTLANPAPLVYPL